MPELSDRLEMEWFASTAVGLCLVALIYFVVRFIREREEGQGKKEKCGCSSKKQQEEKKVETLKQNKAPLRAEAAAAFAFQPDLDSGVQRTKKEYEDRVEYEEDTEDKYKDEVVKFRSGKDRQYYFVASSLENKDQAADKMAELRRREQTLLQALDEMMDGGKRIVASDGVDITGNMRKLVRKHFGKAAPFAEYHNPRSKTVGVNNGKGEMIELCLRSKFDTSEWNSDNTLFRVYVHELAHSADHEYRGDGDEAHGPDFRRIHEHLLLVAERLGLYSCEEYDRSEQRFCGLRLTEESKCGMK